MIKQHIEPMKKEGKKKKEEKQENKENIILKKIRYYQLSGKINVKKVFQRKVKKQNL